MKVISYAKRVGNIKSVNDVQVEIDRSADYAALIRGMIDTDSSLSVRQVVQLSNAERAARLVERELRLNRNKLEFIAMHAA